MEFKADFITYEGVYETILTSKLNVPTSEGRRTILSNHMPIILPIEVGVIETEHNGVLSHYAVNTGVLYFKDNVAEILADSVVNVEKIDVERAISDKLEAQETIAKARREYETIRARNKYEVAENLINAAEKYLNRSAQ